MIDSVTFENYLVLGDVTATFERFTVIVGPNACGKTTLLGGIDRMATYARSGRYLIDGTFRSTGSPVAPSVMLQSGAVRMFSPSDDGRSRDRYHRAQFDSPGASDPDIHEAVDAFGMSELLMLEPSSLRAEASHDVPGQRLQSNGQGLGAMIADITLDRPPLRDRIEDFLRRLVPNVERLSVKTVGNNRGVYQPWITFSNVGELPTERLSEGTLLALGLVTTLVATNRPRLLLIDDIEKGLHPTAQAQLVAILREFLAEDPGLQIICTSHSPYLLHNFAIDEVGVMKLGPDGLARYQRLRDHPEVEKWKDALSAGELWSSVGEDWIAEPEHVG